VQIHTRRLSDRAEEVLETLWEELVEAGRASIELSHPSLLGQELPLEELCQNEFTRVTGDEVELSPNGYLMAEATVRRHRLAEALLTNVLEIRVERVESPACGIEHSLREGVDEAVCTLLGHPTRCPHDKPIPPGPCCKAAAEQTGKEILSLGHLRPGQSGRIAYVQTSEARKLHKMMAMGVLPGKEIRLIQGFPSYVFQVGHSQFAVDQEMAHTIHVRVKP
jgi:DtxR family transcriptional regulator, Mn-dependent transcriptional regulator